MRISKREWFDPALIFHCGQVFHWKSSEGGFIGQSGGRALRLREEKDAWLLDCAPDDEGYWREYFDLARDYNSLLQAQDNACLQEAMLALRGLRVLRQNPWEALMAFLLSSNNHIPRITGLVEKICRTFGGRLAEDLYAFPDPAALSGEAESLRALGCGYRAKYLAATAKALAEGFPLHSLAERPYEEAHKLLCTLSGVGDKVADCVLLFGCGHTEAFPVDVWMERCLPRYGIEGADRRAMSRAARERFGESAGILQQFMFHSARKK